MGGGGKAESPPLVRASGRAATATRGRLFCFGNERAKPSVFPLVQGTEPAGSTSRVAAQERHPCTVRRRRVAWRQAERTTRLLRHRRSAAGRSERASGAPRGKERGKSASGSAQRSRTLSARSRGSVRPTSSRSISAGRRTALAPCDRHRQAETAKAARWSRPAQTGWWNRARCGLVRRHPFSISFKEAMANSRTETIYEGCRPAGSRDARNALRNNGHDAELVPATDRAAAANSIRQNPGGAIVSLKQISSSQEKLND